MALSELNKLELNQETLSNLIPKPEKIKNAACTLHSDVTFVLTCPTHCPKAE